MAGPVVVAGGGITVGDLRGHDLLEVGLGEVAPFRLSGAETGYGARDVCAADAMSGFGRGGDGAGVVDRGQGRAERGDRHGVPGSQGLAQGQLQALAEAIVFHTGHRTGREADRVTRVRTYGVGR